VSVCLFIGDHMFINCCILPILQKRVSFDNATEKGISSNEKQELKLGLIDV